MQYIFYNPKTNKKELVNIVRWKWVAYFQDGTKLEQYDNNGIFHQFAEIKKYRSPVIYFQMISDKNLYGYKLAIPKGADLIHFYRNKKLSIWDTFKRYFIFGWKVIMGGKSIKKLIQINPDDSITLL